jgi:hypothetical protein
LKSVESARREIIWLWISGGRASKKGFWLVEEVITLEFAHENDIVKQKRHGAKKHFDHMITPQ